MADIDEPTGPANPTSLTGTAEGGDKAHAPAAGQDAPVTSPSIAESPPSQVDGLGEATPSGLASDPVGLAAAEAGPERVADHVAMKPAEGLHEVMRVSAESPAIEVPVKHAGSGPSGEAAAPAAAGGDPFPVVDHAVTKHAERSDPPAASVAAPPVIEARGEDATSAAAADRPVGSGGAEAGPATVAESAVVKPAAAPATRVRPATIDARSLVFDPVWYWAQYADVAVAQLDAVAHYLDNGSAEGRDPNPYFSTRYYCEANPDVVSSGMNPFLHYILYGAREGRAPRG